MQSYTGVLLLRVLTKLAGCCKLMPKLPGGLQPSAGKQLSKQLGIVTCATSLGATHTGPTCTNNDLKAAVEDLCAYRKEGFKEGVVDGSKHGDALLVSIQVELQPFALQVPHVKVC